MNKQRFLTPPAEVARRIMQCVDRGAPCLGSLGDDLPHAWREVQRDRVALLRWAAKQDRDGVDGEMNDAGERLSKLADALEKEIVT